MLVALARLGSPEIVGRFSIGLAVTGPIMLFATLKLRSVQATDAKGEYEFSDYLALRLIMMIIALIAVATVIILGGYRGEAAVIIGIIAVAKSAELFSDVLYGAMQREDRLDLIARSLILKGVCSLVTLTVVFALTRSLVWASVALAATWVVIAVSFDGPRAARLIATTRDGKGFRPSWRRLALWPLAKLTIPLGVVTFIGSLSSNVPRYFVERHLGEFELGIFSAILYLMVAGQLVINALGQAATPRLANAFAAGDVRAFRSILVKLMAGGTVVGVFAIATVLVAGRLILRLVYGYEYAPYANVLLLVTVSAAIGFAYVFLGTAVSSMRRFNVQLPIHVVSLVVLIILCQLLVGRYGLTGAAWAILASASVEATGYGLLVRKYVFPRQVLPSLESSGRK